MRLIKRYVSGDDVRQVKDRLVELGYLEKATHNRFGNDSYRAVKAFQAANGLDVDGIVGPLTWNSLFAEEPVPVPDLPSHISTSKRVAIAKDLATVSVTRQHLVAEALRWCIDPDQPQDLKCFYIRGGNLYNGDFKPNIMTVSRLKTYFKKEAYRPYFDGAEETMLAMAERGEIGGCDCSGFIVGLWREAGIVGGGFDATANALYGSYCTETKNPIPGDLAWRSGHIGMYVGGGYVVESAGGHYGVQLTNQKKRKVWDIVSHKLVGKSGWTAYGDPKKY